MDHSVQVAYGQVRAVMLVMGEETPSSRGEVYLGQGEGGGIRVHVSTRTTPVDTLTYSDAEMLLLACPGPGHFW